MPSYENVKYFKDRIVKAENEDQIMIIIKDIYLDGYEDGYLDSVNRRYSNVVSIFKKDKS